MRNNKYDRLTLLQGSMQHKLVSLPGGSAGGGGWVSPGAPPLKGGPLSASSDAWPPHSVKVQVRQHIATTSTHRE